MDLQDQLNNMEPSIQFTMEVENNRALPFLDVAVTRDSKGNLYTTAYRKPAHTNQYLHFKPNHPCELKWSIVQALLHRAETHSSSKEIRRKEMREVCDALKKNGYSSSFIQQCIRIDIKTQDLESPSNTQEDCCKAVKTSNFLSFICSVYFISKKFARMINVSTPSHFNLFGQMEIH